MTAAATCSGCRLPYAGQPTINLQIQDSCIYALASPAPRRNQLPSLVAVMLVLVTVLRRNIARKRKHMHSRRRGWPP